MSTVRTATQADASLVAALAERTLRAGSAATNRASVFPSGTNPRRDIVMARPVAVATTSPDGVR